MKRDPKKWMIKKYYSKKFGPMWCLYAPGDTYSVATAPTFEMAMGGMFKRGYNSYLKNPDRYTHKYEE